MQRRIKDSGLSDLRRHWNKPNGGFAVRARATIKSEELQTRRDSLTNACEVDNALRVQASALEDKIDFLR